MKFDKIMETSQSRTRTTPAEDVVINENRIIADNVEIPLREIEPYTSGSDTQPFNVDEEELNRLIESIRQLGQITPATVRKTDSGKYQIISGHKRYAALTKLGCATMLCRVCNYSDKETFKAVCHANIQRRGEKPTEICKMYNGYRKQFGYDKTVQELSYFFGVSSKTLYRCIHINNLIDELKPLVDSGLLSIHAVEVIDSLSPEQQEILFEYLKKIGKPLTPKAAKQLMEWANTGDEFSVENIEHLLNPKKAKKHYTNPLYNSIYDSHPELIVGVKEDELDNLIYMLLEQHMSSQKDTNVAASPIKWDGEFLKADVDQAILRLAKNADITSVSRDMSHSEFAKKLRHRCKNSGFSSADGNYSVYATYDCIRLSYTRCLNVNGATALILTYTQMAKELISIVLEKNKLSKDNIDDKM